MFNLFKNPSPRIIDSSYGSIVTGDPLFFSWTHHVIHFFCANSFQNTFPHNASCTYPTSRMSSRTRYLHFVGDAAIDPLLFDIPFDNRETTIQLKTYLLLLNSYSNGMYGIGNVNRKWEDFTLMEWVTKEFLCTIILHYFPFYSSQPTFECYSYQIAEQCLCSNLHRLILTIKFALEIIRIHLQPIDWHSVWRSSLEIFLSGPGIR